MGIPETWTLEDFRAAMDRQAEQRAQVREHYRRRWLLLDALGLLGIASGMLMQRLACVPVPRVFELCGVFAIGLNVGSCAARVLRAQVGAVHRGHCAPGA